MLSMTRGDRLTESWMYNNRLQPSTITVGTSGSVFGATMYYCPNKTATCVTNNGNLLAQTLTVNNVDQSFSYDHLNRISTAAEGVSWNQNYGYDAYGNRWVSSSTGVGGDSFTPIAASNFDAKTGCKFRVRTTIMRGTRSRLEGTRLCRMRKAVW